ASGNGEIVSAEGGQLAACIHDGVAAPGAVTSVGHETTSIRRAGDRLGDGDLPALAARDRGERREPLGLGHAWRSCCIPPCLALSRLEHLDARLYHDSALLLYCFSAERDGFADAKLAQAPGPLDRRR